MSGDTDKINIIELLMEIKEDVSSIKTDMANFKEVQKLENASIMREINDVRSDYQKDIDSLEKRVMSRINGLQSVQASLVGDVDTLKQAEDRKDAHKYRRVVAFILTALGGMAVAKFPDLVVLLVKSSVGGN